METRQFDAIIIGFGKGGKTLAAELAHHGKKTAIVERSDKMYGGTCINIGCIPTKTLVHLAKEAATMTFKSFDERRDFYRKATATKDRVTSALRKANYDKLAGNPEVTIFTGEGSFASKNSVLVKAAAGEILLEAPRIFINTGSESITPAIEGIAGNPFVYNSTTLMEMQDLPEKMVIIGGGYIGLEFASMYTSFGSQVTVLEGGSRFIPREDEDIAEAVKARLEKMGVKIILNADVKSVKSNGSAASVSFSVTGSDELQTLEAQAVLLATGRRPAIASLNLDTAGIKTDSRGAIAVDDHLVTSNPDVRALGDVKGGLQFTYISLDDYRIVREDLFGSKDRKLSDRVLVPYSVFIDPPMARVGISEDQARQAGMDIIVRKLPVSTIPRAKTLGESDGLLKAVIDAKTDAILGCTLFCPEASEIINTVALAMNAKLPAKSLHDFIFTHPSMSEALNDLF